MADHEFQPKEWVLCRDDDCERWKLGIFSHFVDGTSFRYACIGDRYSECIPYEGNEHLLGTKDAPKEKKTEGWKVGDKVEVEYDTDKKWYSGEIVRISLNYRSCVDSEAMPYYVRSECFKYNDGCAFCAARQLRKPKEAKEEEEFKFGDKVEANFAGDWREAVIVQIDSSSIPYKVATADGDIHWRRRGDVRHA